MKTETRLHGELNWEEKTIFCGQCRKEMTVLSTNLDELNRAWISHSVDHFKGTKRKKPRDKGAIV